MKIYLTSKINQNEMCVQYTSYAVVESGYQPEFYTLNE